VPILDVLMAEAREHIANDPAWRVSAEGEALERDNQKLWYHLDELLQSRITTKDDAKAVMAELIDYWPVVWDMSFMGDEETWVVWVVAITYRVLVENFDPEHPVNGTGKPLDHPVLPYPDSASG
jgi:hypothetical protein